MRTDRGLRYSGLNIPHQTPDVLIVGCGAIGSQVARMLSAMQLTRAIGLMDGDHIEEVNLGPQQWPTACVGRSKVSALEEMLYALNPSCMVLPSPTHWTEQTDPSDHAVAAVFCCVDSMSARNMIWHNMKDLCAFFCDGRMGAENLRIFTVANRDPDAAAHYESELFPDEEAEQLPCTARATAYCANIAAGLMVAQYTAWLRQHHIEPDFSLNIPALELSPNTPTLAGV